MSNNFNFGSKQIEQKLCNFDLKETKGTVEVVALKHFAHKDQKMTFRCFKNPRTGEWFGIPVGMNPDGTYKFKPITITNHRIYNLENTEDAMEYFVVKNHHKVKGSPIEDANPMFYIRNEELEAEIEIKKSMKAAEAINFIGSLKGNQLMEWGMLFNINPASVSPSIIKKRLMETCKTNPNSIIDKIEQKETYEILTIVKRGIMTGIINHSVDRGYTYNALPVGTTEMAVVDFLRRDKQLMAAIDLDGKKNDRYYNAAETETKLPETPFKKNDDDDSPESSFGKKAKDILGAFKKD